MTQGIGGLTEVPERRWKHGLALWIGLALLLGLNMGMSTGTENGDWPKWLGMTLLLFKMHEVNSSWNNHHVSSIKKKCQEK